MCIAGFLIKGIEPLEVFFIVCLIAGIAEIVQLTALPACKSTLDLDGCFRQFLRCKSLGVSVVNIYICLIYCSQPSGRGFCLFTRAR